MATLKSDMVLGNQSFKPFPSGAVGVRYSSHSITAALAAADIVQMVDVFAGETVHDIKMVVTDLDTNASPAIVLDVGDGSDPDYYIDGSTAGQAGGNDELDANVAPKVYSADDTIDITVQAGPGTGATTGTLQLWVYVS